MYLLKFCCNCFTLLFLVLLSGCDKCQDCDPLDVNDPGLFMTFIDETNINEVKGYIEVYVNDSSRTNNALRDRTESLQNSEATTAQIAADPEIIRLKAEISNINTRLTNEKNYLAILEKGETEIQKYHIIGSAQSFSFKKDTMFRFSLRPDTTFTSFRILFNGREDTIGFTYGLDVYPGDQRIKIKAIEIKEGTHTFKRVELDNTTIPNETRAKAFY